MGVRQLSKACGRSELRLASRQRTRQFEPALTESLSYMPNNTATLVDSCSPTESSSPSRCPTNLREPESAAHYARTSVILGRQTEHPGCSSRRGYQNPARPPSRLIRPFSLPTLESQFLRWLYFPPPLPLRVSTRRPFKLHPLRSNQEGVQALCRWRAGPAKTREFRISGAGLRATNVAGT